MAAAYWIGQDGNAYVKSSTGVTNMGKPQNASAQGFDAPGANGGGGMTVQAELIADPLAPSGGGDGDGAAAPEVDKDAAERARLKSSISGRGAEVDAAYAALFKDLDELVKSRDFELEAEYGGQLTKASETYTDALPVIDQSYAAIGSYDSTQRSDSRGKAKKGFEDTTRTINTNKGKDKAAIGQFKRESEAKFTADRDSAKRAINSSAATTDVDALRSFSNNLDTNLAQTGVTRATLGTDGAARKTVSDLTKDNGRFEAAVGALDSILKSSMGSDVKQAAVKAVTDSAGLSDDEKKKVQETYGNVYAEQQAL